MMKNFLTTILVFLLAFPSFVFGAIAFDTSGGAAVNPGSSATVTLTLSGTNRYSFVGVWNGNDPANFTVTCNGTNMPHIGSALGSGATEILYGLANCTSGSHDFVVTSNIGATTILVNVSSYNGVGSLEATTTAFDDSTGVINPSITTVCDNAWTVMGVSGLFLASSDSTIRDTELAGRQAFFDTNGPIHPAGSHSMNANDTGYTHIAGVMASICPVAANPFVPLPIFQSVLSWW